MTPEPIRLLHHFACTGGTLISRIVASMPNVVLLNEIDPLSQLDLEKHKQPFFPTDLIAALQYSRRDVNDETIASMFMAALSVLRTELSETGRHLVLRDHTHSKFCVGSDIASRPSIREICSAITASRSVVTVRHPLSSYVSLTERRWVHFYPKSLEEYARRYIAFLDAHHDIPVFRYEDLVSDPDVVTRQICECLALPFVPSYERTLSAFSFSGDSGRTGNRIQERPQRPFPSATIAESEVSQSYAQLCDRLGYGKSFP